MCPEPAGSKHIRRWRAVGFPKPSRGETVSQDGARNPHRSATGSAGGRARPRNDRDGHPRPARPAAVVGVALESDHRPRDRLDPRRPGGHDRRRDRGARLGQGQRASASRRPRSPAAARRCTWRVPASARSSSASSPIASARKRLFMVTLGVYLVGDGRSRRSRLTALCVLRLPLPHRHGHRRRVRAINSAIDELIPASQRGRVDISINGSYWAGRSAGALLAIVAADHAIFSPIDVGLAPVLRARAMLGVGDPDRPAQRPGEPALAVHPRPRRGGRARSIETSNDEVPQADREATLPEPDEHDHDPPAQDDRALRDDRAIVSRYPRRTVLGLALFIGQAFLYNAILFSLRASC